MNLRLIVFYCILITSLIYAYKENNMADLIVPTQIAPKSLEVNIVHRFLRDPAGDFPDNFVKLANVNLHL